MPDEILDLSDPELATCPYPIFTRLRASAPVCPMQLPDGRRAWFVTKYDDVRRLMKDHERFSNRWMVGQQAEVPGLSPKARTAMSLFADMMLGTDPPEHTRLRDSVRKAFTPRLVESLRPYVQGLADELLDAVVLRASQTGERTLDLIADYAEPLPIAVILELLGIPPGDRDAMRRWGAAAGFNGSVAEAEAIADDIDDFLRYSAALLECKRRDPQEDLLSALVQTADGAETLTDSELASMIFLLMFAGHETTTHSIAQGMMALFAAPDSLDALRADPALLKPAVEEILRFDTSVPIPRPRVALVDCEIAGVRIGCGDVVVPGIGSANRDEDRYDHADRLDIGRVDNRHLTFGRGIHTCLGAPLGRVEVQIAIATLLRRMPDLRMAVEPDELQWRSGGRRRGVIALPLTF